MAKFILSEEDNDKPIKVHLKKSSRGVIVALGPVNVFEFIDGQKKIFRWSWASETVGLENAGDEKCAITDVDPF
jgi:hypothetical protein